MNQVNIKSVTLFTSGIVLLLFFHFVPIGFGRDESFDMKPVIRGNKTSLSQSNFILPELEEKGNKDSIHQ